MLAWLAGLEQRVTALERARRAPYPRWRHLPLTGATAVPDAAQPSPIRANPWNTLEFSGRGVLLDGWAADEAVIVLPPEGYRAAVPRTVPVASDAARRELHLGIDPKGYVTLRVQDGGSVKATWISLDGASCRLDSDDDDEE
ncbi:hypothetical protein [Streptomyces sp. YGL11-2]|uniref:hypothetical protein n=1 Tax=Streptomyces sp. YGL11-2 TaxID=3414028 RepID=UPI003CEE62F7